MKKYLLMTVAATLMTLLGAGGARFVGGWLGDGVGVGGVRAELRGHAEDESVHPNVGRLHAQMESLSSQQTTMDTKLNTLDGDVKTMIGLLGQIRGRLPAQ